MNRRLTRVRSRSAHALARPPCRPRSARSVPIRSRRSPSLGLPRLALERERSFSRSATPLAIMLHRTWGVLGSRRSLLSTHYSMSPRPVESVQRRRDQGSKSPHMRLRSLWIHAAVGWRTLFSRRWPRAQRPFKPAAVMFVPIHSGPTVARTVSFASVLRAARRPIYVD